MKKLPHSTSADYLSRIGKSIKSFCLSILICVILIFLTPQITLAYDNDTHFWLTYYLALKAGYTKTQATQIASANISVDFDKDTEPLTPSFDHWTDWFHALSHYANYLTPMQTTFFNYRIR
jgi:hypothetical protein